MSKLQEIYDLRSVSGNVSEHMPTFRKYAKQCEHITEFGFGGGWAASGFLIENPKKYVTYDIDLQGIHNDYREMVKPNTEFVAIQADTAKIEIEPTDLLFIDSMHTYSHLKKELTKHAYKVGKWIIMHDTTTYGAGGQDGSRPGLVKAIEEFLEDNPQWIIKEVFTNCHGLTVLERK